MKLLARALPVLFVLSAIGCTRNEPAEITPLQWTVSRLVPAAMRNYPFTGGHVTIGGADDPDKGTPYSWLSERFPYLVPADKWLLITDVNFASKQLGTRNSYFILQNIVTVNSSPGIFSPRVPIIVPAGTTVNAQIFNNTNEAQWMNAIVSGFLINQLSGETYQHALARAIVMAR